MIELRFGSLTSKDAFAFVDLDAGRDVLEVCEVNHQLLHYVTSLLESGGALLERLVGRKTFVHFVHHFNYLLQIRLILVNNLRNYF